MGDYTETQMLVQLVSYQEESVVSREIIRKKTGIVTIFAFDKNQCLSEHIAPFDAIVHILDGEAKVTIDGKSYNLTSGQMIIMPSGKPHALKAIKKFKMLLTMIKS
ncbi:MAG: cupin domain-containing protein [Candidatus Micrarchaeota archaeon]